MNASDAFDLTLGVLQYEANGEPPFTEKKYCQQLSIAGRKYGIRIIVFSPLWIDWCDHTVYAYVFNRSGWEQHKFPLPPLAYDRCVYCYPYFNQYKLMGSAIARMKKQAAVVMLGVSLPGKWDIYHTLIKAPSLISILPPTELFRGTDDLVEQLERYRGELFLKPHSGIHGKLTLCIRRRRSGKLTNLLPSTLTYLECYGRDRRNRCLYQNFSQLQHGLAWIKRFVGKRKFIIQPYLSLISQIGEPFDIRVLMQKNETGIWNFTGMAVRVGNRDNITSNLNGGGHAFPVIPFLERQFEKNDVRQLVQQLRKYSKYIPPLLEAQYGRISEMGLDFGIDLNVRLWLLEVNSKPGRSIFNQTGDYDAALKSVENPILYARHVRAEYLLRGGVHELDGMQRPFDAKFRKNIICI